MTHQTKKITQASIGRALGLSRSAITKYKHAGMPVTSIEAAMAWHRDSVRPTAHKMLNRNPATPPQPRCHRLSGAVQHALALLGIAAAALEAGQTIAAMVPTLRAALHAVPVHERDETMLFPVAVMDLLTAEVFAVIADPDNANECTKPGEPMTDEEAEYMGRFWYQVAAGEIRPE